MFRKKSQFVNILDGVEIYNHKQIFDKKNRISKIIQSSFDDIRLFVLSFTQVKEPLKTFPVHVLCFFLSLYQNMSISNLFPQSLKECQFRPITITQILNKVNFKVLSENNRVQPISFL